MAGVLLGGAKSAHDAPSGRSAGEGLSFTIAVCAMGYFVDVYDLGVFSVVRLPSLLALGVPMGETVAVGATLLNIQSAGLLLGGFLWGILGDKRGRKTVLFGSIALYSVANIANAFATDLPTYAALRFVAGVGLAGELGIAITLVGELSSTQGRGRATTLVAGVGILGGLAAAAVGIMADWRIAFLLGGVMGLALLLLRFRIADSPLFSRAEATGVKRGDLWLLFGSRARVKRYVACALVGLPVWFALGILATFAPEIAQSAGVAGAVRADVALLLAYPTSAIGGIVSGWTSERWRSRWNVLYAFLGVLAAAALLMPFARGWPPEAFYALFAALGFGVGYWALFATVAAEQFGTNLRATVATTTPNLVRGGLIPMTLAVQAGVVYFPLGGVVLVVGAATILAALAGLWLLEETYGRDLDFVEA